MSRSVELVEADPTRDRALLDRLLQLYEYDDSEYGGVDVDEQGLFPTEDLDARWTPGYDVYLLRVDGQTAGFAMATRQPSYLDGTEVTFLDTFFVTRKYRRQGVGTRAAHALFRRYPGRWELTTATGNEVARAFWPRATVDAIRRLWDGRETFLTVLEALPQTLGHGDAIRRNLLAHRARDGSEETIAIDWEFAGHFALGEEVGQTLSVAAAFFHLEPTELPALDEALFAGYLAGLRDVGRAGHERRIRFAYCAHAALRNLFNAVGATVPDEARRAAVRQNQGRSWEELAERRAAIRPFLLERADEARGLLAAL